MSDIENLRHILSVTNRPKKVRCPAIDELPPEARGVNFDPSAAGSASVGKRILRRYGIGERILFFNVREGAFEEGVIVRPRTKGRYQVRSLYDGRNRIVDARSFR